MKTDVLRRRAASSLALIAFTALTGCDSMSPTAPTLPLADRPGARPSATTRPAAPRPVAAAAGSAARPRPQPSRPFAVRGIPEGGLTLVFTSGGGEVGRVVIDRASADPQSRLTFTLASSASVSVEPRRHAGIEADGLVQAVSPASGGDVTFRVGARTVRAEAGRTIVRRGERAVGLDELADGQRVHLRGAMLESAPGAVAHEVVLHEAPLPAVAANGAR